MLSVNFNAVVAMINRGDDLTDQLAPYVSEMINIYTCREPRPPRGTSSYENGQKNFFVEY